MERTQQNILELFIYAKTAEKKIQSKYVCSREEGPRGKSIPKRWRKKEWMLNEECKERQREKDLEGVF